MSCGSGFPAAIRIGGVREIRGWEAAPTVGQLLTLTTSGFYKLLKK
jgi:hypothetical protein